MGWPLDTAAGDVLHSFQLRGIGPEEQQNDVVRHLEFTPWLVPAGPIAEQRSDRARGDLVLISWRCRFMHSVLAVGVIIAAPTGQMAPTM
jgi:hypothetical protein